MKRTNLATARVWVGASLLALSSAVCAPEVLGQAICAAAKLELGQEAALEREGFTARLSLTNNLGDLPLSDLRVDVLILDAQGQATTDRFFVAVTSLEGVAGVDGTGTVQAAGTAKASWLIVPTAGAGGTDPVGVRYTAQARMTFHTGGVPRVVTTFPVAITVKPQPLLQLEYVLPFEVFGDEPLTQVVESTQPFPLGLRVSNVGAGLAKKFTVESGQPKIVENEQSLAVDFSLLGTWVGSKALPENTFLINFGDIPPGGASLAAWSMVSSLSGRFTEFTSTFTHAAELGGALTSLIQSATTYTLVKDVLVDLPGRDAQFDFLVNVTTPREQLEADFRLGIEPRPEFLMESDRPGLTPIVEVPGQLVGTPSGTSSVLNYRFLSPVATGTWVHSSVPLASGAAAPLVSVTRADGKVVNARNAWVSRHFDKDALAYSYFLHVLDYTGEAPADYAMAFNATALDVPPSVITDLAASPYGQGALELTWTAPGEDGGSGAIFGGRYAVFATTDPIAAPSVQAALVNFTTSTSPGSVQSYRLTGLTGNATYHVTVYAADSGGQFSAASNRAAARTFAYPPRDVRVLELGATSFALAWDTSANAPGTLYQLQLSSGPGLVLDAAPFTSDLSSIAYAGLDANKTYFVSSLEKNGSSALTPAVTIATVTTSALLPGTTSPAFIAITTDSVTARWTTDGNPPDTEFYSELSTSASRAPVFAAGGWTASSGFTFAGLPPGTEFYGRVKARNRILVETAYADLGAVRTTPVDNLPPRTAFAPGSPRHGDSPVYIATSTPLGFMAFDDKAVEGDGVGLGVARTFFAVDSSSFSAYTGTFTLVALGTHTIQFYSVDVLGNAEVARSTQVAVDGLPARTAVAFGEPKFAGASLYLSSTTPILFSAADDLAAAGDGLGVGTARTLLSLDEAPFATAASTMTISTEGAHVLAWFSLDLVDNAELLAGTSVAVDLTPPVTQLDISTPMVSQSSGTVIGPATVLSLAALDPVSSGTASGLKDTFLAVSTSVFTLAPATFTLAGADGARVVSFYSRDNVLNAEQVVSATVLLDATPPVTTLSIGAPRYAAPDGTLFVGSAAAFALASEDPTVQEVASGVSAVSARVDAAPFTLYGATFTLAPGDGLRTVSWFAADNVGNAETPKVSTVALDATPPQTSLLIAGGRQLAGPDAATFYASSDTKIVLVSIDPSVNGAASGVAFTRWQDDAGAFQTYLSGLALAEGAHGLAYQSSDNVENLEVPRSTNVWIDATPPVSSFAFGAPYHEAPDGTHYVTPATPVTFSANDPALPTGQPGSGVSRVEIAVDGGPFAAYTSSLTFAEGRHTVLYRSIDGVANVEATRALDIRSDATAPLTSLALSGGHQFQGPDALSFFASADTLYSLPAVDPLVKDVASGAAFTRRQDNGGPFQLFAAPFTLAEGVHHLGYQSQDHVQNLEVPLSTTALVDATAPRTSLAVVGGYRFPGPDAATFYASSDTRLALPAFDPVAGGVASGLAFTRYQDGDGPFQTFVSTFGLSEGAHRLGYHSQDNVHNLELLRSTDVWIDAAPPVSSFAFGAPYHAAPDGTHYITPATPVTFSAVDPTLPTGQPGSGVSRIEVAIDGGPFAVYAAALTFAEGRHTILYRAVDNVANVETVRTLSVQSDATPPVSSLVVGEPWFQLPSVLLVSTGTPFSIAPVDPIVNDVASGVKDTSFRVSDISPGTAAFAVFSAPFTMAGADVNKVIEFFSRDHVLNTEVVKSSTVLLDSTPPEIALLSPASCGAGICRVLKGRFPVLGTARDAHFGHYRLEFAPGQDAAAGFVFISSGTLAVSSGTLGTWDATALSGWHTVRLSAADLVANAAAVTLNVFVGDPGRLMLLGDHEMFNMPEGVAVGADGKIYVADRNNDRIAVFSSTGALLASFGGRKNDDEDHGKHEKSTTTLRLNKPSGVAVDAAGGIYVADTNRDRVLKLSAEGQVLLSLGRFRHPAGVAVDAAGGIYVADTGNHRVQVFSSTGAFSFQFDLPPVPSRLDDDGDDDGDEKGARLGEPFAVAVDAAGGIYVADPKGGRALKFGPTGELLLTIPITGGKPGSRGQPFGVAVSTGGDCLLVSDRKTSRILKFDFLGNANLVFASKGKIKDHSAPAPGGAIVLLKPMGLALDAEGSLFVADRNNGRVQKFGLPTGEPALVVPAPKPEDEHVARGVVDTEDGGTVSRRDLAAVDIPAGAVAVDLRVTVSTPAFSLADDSNRRRAAEDAKLKTASPPVEYGPHGTQFEKPVTLTLPYSPELLTLQNIDEADLQVRYWNRGKSQWEDLESVVDPETRTVKAKTTHFSLYQVFSGTVSAAALAPLAADATFAFRDAYAFPNPVRGSGPVTIRIQTGQADSVEVRVYDVSGRKIHSSSNFSLDTNFDDGNGKGAQYTYDHAWDVSGVGSGVYRYVITAKKSGQSDIHKTGRVGVVK
ncbi:MAG: hypothetical protein Q8T11_17790 [Elusimicrobiota bacterium]|nr:hypothetical protein [Elusimicrobiota bacterium]